MNLKKILALVLVFTMCLSLIPTYAFAEDEGIELVEEEPDIVEVVDEPEEEPSTEPVEEEAPAEPVVEEVPEEPAPVEEPAAEPEEEEEEEEEELGFTVSDTETFEAVKVAAVVDAPVNGNIIDAYESVQEAISAAETGENMGFVEILPAYTTYVTTPSDLEISGNVMLLADGYRLGTIDVKAGAVLALVGGIYADNNPVPVVPSNAASINVYGTAVLTKTWLSGGITVYSNATLSIPEINNTNPDECGSYGEVYKATGATGVKGYVKTGHFDVITPALVAKGYETMNAGQGVYVQRSVTPDTVILLANGNGGYDQYSEQDKSQAYETALAGSKTIIVVKQSFNAESFNTDFDKAGTYTVDPNGCTVNPTVKGSASKKLFISNTTTDADGIITYTVSKYEAALYTVSNSEYVTSMPRFADAVTYAATHTDLFVFVPSDIAITENNAATLATGTVLIADKKDIEPNVTLKSGVEGKCVVVDTVVQGCARPVTAYTLEPTVCTLNNVPYPSLRSAIADVTATNKDIKLYQSVTVAAGEPDFDTVTIATSTNIDLDRFTVSASNCDAFHVTAGTVNFIGTGSISANTGFAAVYAEGENTTVTFAAGVTVTTVDGVDYDRKATVTKDAAASIAVPATRYWKDDTLLSDTIPYQFWNEYGTATYTNVLYVIPDNTIASPTDVTAPEGFTIVWTTSPTDLAGTETYKWDFTQPVATDTNALNKGKLNLFGYEKRNHYTLTVNMGDWAFASTPTILTQGEGGVYTADMGYDWPLPTAEQMAVAAREGWTFDGYKWTYGTVVATDTALTNMPASDVTVTATGHINTYIQSIDPNGGTFIGGGLVGTNTVLIPRDYDTTFIHVWPHEIERYGYTLVGWEWKYATQTNWNPTTTDLPETMPATDTDMKAIWKANEWTWYVMPGEGASFTYEGFKNLATWSTLLEYDKPLSSKAGWAENDFTKTGYKYLGIEWKLATQTDWNATSTDLPTTMPNDDLYFRASWTPNEHVWTVKPGEGASFSETSGLQNVATFTSIVPFGKELSSVAGFGANDFTKTGYRYLGLSWNDADGNTLYNYATSTNASPSDLPTTMPDYDLTYTAQWEKDEFLVTVDPGDGAFTEASGITTATYSELKEYESPLNISWFNDKMEYEDHTLLGFSWVEDGTTYYSYATKNTEATPLPTSMPAYPLTFTAQWATTVWTVDAFPATATDSFDKEIDETTHDLTISNARLEVWNVEFEGMKPIVAAVINAEYAAPQFVLSTDTNLAKVKFKFVDEEDWHNYKDEIDEYYAAYYPGEEPDYTQVTVPLVISPFEDVEALISNGYLTATWTVLIDNTGAAIPVDPQTLNVYLDLTNLTMFAHDLSVEGNPEFTVIEVVNGEITNNSAEASYVDKGGYTRWGTIPTLLAEMEEHPDWVPEDAVITLFRDNVTYTFENTDPLTVDLNNKEGFTVLPAQMTEATDTELDEDHLFYVEPVDSTATGTVLIVPKEYEAERTEFTYTAYHDGKPIDEPTTTLYAYYADAEDALDDAVFEEGKVVDKQLKVYVVKMFEEGNTYVLEPGDTLIVDNAGEAVAVSAVTGSVLESETTEVEGITVTKYWVASDEEIAPVVFLDQTAILNGADEDAVIDPISYMAVPGTLVIDPGDPMNPLDPENVDAYEKPGYRFDHFYADEALTTLYDWSQPIPEEGVTIYGRFLKDTYTLTLDVGDVECTIPAAWSLGKEYTIDTPSLALPNFGAGDYDTDSYQFMGWVQEDGTLIAAGDPYVIVDETGEVENAQSETLTARFRQRHVDVRFAYGNRILFRINGATVGSNINERVAREYTERQIAAMVEIPEGQTLVSGKFWQGCDNDSVFEADVDIYFLNPVDLFEVNFYGNGITLNSIDVPDGELVPAAQIPQIRLNGEEAVWHVGSEEGEIVDLNEFIVVEPVDLYATFAKQYTVTFVFDNGDDDMDKNVISGETVDKPEDPEKEGGFAFVNWYEQIEDEEGEFALAEEPFDFETPIEENITLVAVYDFTVEHFKDVRFAASAQLEQSINLNFKMTNVPEDTVIDNYTAVVTVADNGEVENKFTLRNDGVTYSTVAERAYAFQMNEPVTIKVYYGDLLIKTVEGYSLRKYFENRYAATVGAEKTMFKAALDYGAQAQKYFNVDTDNLANATVNPNNTLPTPAQPNAKASRQGVIEGVTAYKASLVMDSEISVKFKINPESIDDFTFRVTNGFHYSVNRTPNNGLYEITVTGYNPLNLDTPVTLTIIKGGEQVTITYSPYAYANSKWNSTEPGMADLVKCMVAFSEAVNEAQLH